MSSFMINFYETGKSFKDTEFNVNKKEWQQLKFCNSVLSAQQCKEVQEVGEKKQILLTKYKN